MRPAIPATVSQWYELEIVVTEDREEAAAAAFFDAGSVGLQYESVAEGIRLLAYFSGAPNASALSVAYAACGELPRRPTLRAMEDDETDWSENWKAHFAPIAVGASLYVCPPWDPSAPGSRIPLVINPGMAFGTGQHATTRGCLHLIEQVCAQRTINRAADIGTGSGILAIAMARLGVASVAAVDNDPVALAAAADNLRLNRLGDQVQLGSSLAVGRDSCDLVVANLFANLLVEMAADLTALCADEAILICSGMLESDADTVRLAFEPLDWRLFAHETESPWCTLGFERVSR